MLQDIAAHAREDVTKITEPKAQALFETSAEVLLGLSKAFEDYEQQNEPAWKPKAHVNRTTSFPIIALAEVGLAM